METKYIERTFTCIGCNKLTTKRTSKSSTKYCTFECYRTSKRPNSLTGKIINCVNCGCESYKKLVFLKKSTNFFCSLTCANEYQKRNKVKINCHTCNKEFFVSKSKTVNGNNRKYCNISCRNNDEQHMMDTSLKGNLANLNKVGLNKLEKKGSEILNDLNIEHDTQVPMFGKFVVDVLVKDKKIIIQWDGEYWHNKPKRKNLDISQDSYLIKCGYKVIRITDKQIKNNIEEVYQIIIKSVKSYDV